MPAKLQLKGRSDNISSCIHWFAGWRRRVM